MSEASWADALCKVIDERDALAKQLATARNGALNDARDIAEEVESMWRDADNNERANIAGYIRGEIEGLKDVQ